MDILEKLEQLSLRMNYQEDAELIQRAIVALTPPRTRLIKRIASYIGPGVLVEDVLAELGLAPTMGVVVGKILAELGYVKTMISFDKKVYPIWTKSCRYPKHELNQILARRWPERLRRVRFS